MQLAPKEGVRFVFTLYHNEEPLRDVHLFIFGSKIPTEATQEDIDRIEYEGAKRYVLKKLSQKAFASTELKALLKKYLVAEKTIQIVLEECMQKGYLDDQAWVESFIRSHMRRKCGPDAIKLKLLHKRIPLSLIESALHSLDSTESRQERIQALLQSRYKNRNLCDFNERQKTISALVRKGFGLDDIYETLTNYASN